MTKHLKEKKCNAGLSNQKKKEKQNKKEIKKNLMILGVWNRHIHAAL